MQVISPSNVGQLTENWRLFTGHDVSATISTFQGTAFIVDWGGNTYAVNATTGAEKWRVKIGDLLPTNVSAGLPPGIFLYSRTTPAIDPTSGIAVIGTQANSVARDVAYVIGVNITDGQALWFQRINTHPIAVVTLSPSIEGGYAYVGFSSLEEPLGNGPVAAALGFPGYVCCSFMGSLSKMDVKTGNVEWTFYTQPPLPEGTSFTDWYAGEGHARIWVLHKEGHTLKKRKTTYRHAYLSLCSIHGL